MYSKEQLAELVFAISHRNCQRSFRKLFDLYYNTLFGVARYYVKNTLTAEEVISDLFVKLWKNREGLSEIRDIRRYLLVSIKRQSLNALRGQKPPVLYIDSLEHFSSIEIKDPEKQLFSKEFLEFMSECIQRLPPRCGLIFKMVKEEGMKYREVAEALDLSEKTVEMQMTSALKRIRIELDKYHNYHKDLPKVSSRSSFFHLF